MRKNRLLIGAAAAAVLLALSAPVWGDGNVPSLYKIKKGDTLWDISRSEFRDPFRWPFIWKENPKVKNPDRIYPGEKLNIPALPAVRETAGSAKTPAYAPAATAAPAAPATRAPKARAPREKTVMKPVEKKYLFSDDDILSSGFITKKISPAGVVTMPGEDAPEIITAGDDLYMRTSIAVKVGEKFLVAGVSRIDDPVTGDFAGYLVEPHGLAQVEEAPAGQAKKPWILRAKVSRAFQGIMPGDVLLKYRKPEKVLRGAGGRPDVAGRILALKGEALIGAGFNVVYLNKGSAEGLKPGDLLETMKGPQKNALLEIISVEPQSATALVRESRTVVKPGDEFTGVANAPAQD